MEKEPVSPVVATAFRETSPNYLVRDQEIGGSNPLAPTKYPFHFIEFRLLKSLALASVFPFV